MPLENLLRPVGDLYCLSNTFRMLVKLKTVFTYSETIIGYKIGFHGKVSKN